MASNQAAWLDKPGSKLRIGDIALPEPSPDGLVVRNEAIAVNPADWKIQDTGGHITKYPMILGEDIAGEVVSVGSDIQRFKVGDHVLAHTDSLITQLPADGGFALYTHVRAAATALIPAKTSYTEACVLPLALYTAATGLYSPVAEGYFGLPYPTPSPKPAAALGKVMLIWGGASSVGVTTIHLAVASGMTVFTTASPRNFGFCRICGASEVFDYRSPSVVEDIVRAVKASELSWVGVYDGISEPASYDLVLPILEKLGGGSLTVVLPPPTEEVPSGVAVGAVFGFKNTEPMWTDFVTQALESGQLKCLPEPMVVGEGLESVQEGLEVSKRGVSARKVVVEL